MRVNRQKLRDGCNPCAVAAASHSPPACVCRPEPKPSGESSRGVRRSERCDIAIGSSRRSGGVSYCSKLGTFLDIDQALADDEEELELEFELLELVGAAMMLVFRELSALCWL